MADTRHIYQSSLSKSFQQTRISTTTGSWSIDCGVLNSSYNVYVTMYIFLVKFTTSNGRMDNKHEREPYEPRVNHNQEKCDLDAVRRIQNSRSILYFIGDKTKEPYRMNYSGASDTRGKTAVVCLPFPVMNGSSLTNSSWIGINLSIMLRLGSRKDMKFTFVREAKGTHTSGSRTQYRLQPVFTAESGGHKDLAKLPGVDFFRKADCQETI